VAVREGSAVTRAVRLADTEEDDVPVRVFVIVLVEVEVCVEEDVAV